MDPVPTRDDPPWHPRRAHPQRYLTHSRQRLMIIGIIIPLTRDTILINIILLHIPPSQKEKENQKAAQKDAATITLTDIHTRGNEVIFSQDVTCSNEKIERNKKTN